MNGIRFENVSKNYHDASAPAVDDISLEVPEGKFVVLLGPSGCGKTTLLKMVNRLLEPEKGSIFINGVDIRKIEVTQLRRRIGYVIQQVGLFPHMTIEQNISTVPVLLKWEKNQINRRIDELMELVHLPLDFRKRYPAQLSGGQQQRVGLARALAADPDVLLMDEPFGAIDAITRNSLQIEMVALQSRLKKTVLFVTHDVDEALRLADLIVVLRHGKLEQFAAPCDILNKPANGFVRELLDADDRIRQISLLRVGAVMGEVPNNYSVEAGTPTLKPDDDLRKALSILLQPGVSHLTVVENNKIVGVLTINQIRGAGCIEDAK